MSFARPVARLLAINASLPMKGTSRSAECRERAYDPCRIGLDPDVEIAGRTRQSVKRQRVRAYNQKPNVSPSEGAQ